MTPIIPEKTATPMALPHLGASADRRDERHDAHDERHRRHQDRTKSQTACFDRRLHRIAPGQFKLARKLDDQNGVLRRQTDKDDQADLREDVVVALREIDAVIAASSPIGTIMMIDSGRTRLSY